MMDIRIMLHTSQGNKAILVLLTVIIETEEKDALFWTAYWEEIVYL